MKHFTEEQKRAARKADLYDYLCRNFYDSFVDEHGSLRFKENRSITIKKGFSGYKDWATDEHGNSIDFLVRYMGFAIDDAVLALSDGMVVDASRSIVTLRKPDLKDTKIVFPEATSGRYRQLYAYLNKTRCIPSEMIQWLIDQKLMYQATEYNNIVFINYEKDWGELHGTYTGGEKSFHRLAAGSREDGFWFFRTSKGAKTAYVCEGAIDAISLYVMHNNLGLDKYAYYFSIGGAGKQQAIDRIKRNLTVVIATDNDDAGNNCRSRNSDCESIMPVHKDWNEDLVHLNNKA